LAAELAVFIIIIIPSIGRLDNWLGYSLTVIAPAAAAAMAHCLVTAAVTATEWQQLLHNPSERLQSLQSLHMLQTLQAAEKGAAKL
jgi:hypothetical protein